MDNKRILIYYANDSLEKIEKYSEYFLTKILEYFSDIILVSNYDELEISQKKIKSKIKKNIVSVEPVHCLQAYYMGVLFIKSQNLTSFEEIVCVSDNIMGPVWSMDDVFFSMNKKKCDFWGITKQNPTPANYLDYSGTNLQDEYIIPDFLVFGHTILENNDLLPILKDLENVADSKQTIVDFKALWLNSELKKRGYVSATYVDTDDIKNMYYNPLLMIPKEMVEDRRCPIFLKTSFLGDYNTIISNTSGQAAVQLYNYLNSRTEYDVDMIWEAVLKVGHQQDINSNMHLNYILSSTECNYAKLNNILNNKKIALIMHLYYPDLVEESLHYAESMPECSDIFITTNTEEKKKIIELTFGRLKCNKLEVRLIANRGRDVSSLLTGVKDVIMDYDYVCFAHDKKSTQIIPGSIGHDFGYQCFENILCSKAYVGNIICEFHENKRLGMLSPLYAVHGTCYPVYGKFDWGANYDNTKKLSEELGLTIPISKEKSPVAPLGTMFWFRPLALKPLYDYNWEYEDFPQEPNGYDGTLLHAIERIYSFVVQQQGYYPAMVGNVMFANISLTNMTHFLQGINRTIDLCQGFCSYQQALYSISKAAEDLGNLSRDNENLRNENNNLKNENKIKQNQIEDLLPKTSLKWQIKHRIKTVLHIKR